MVPWGNTGSYVWQHFTTLHQCNTPPLDVSPFQHQHRHSQAWASHGRDQWASRIWKAVYKLLSMAVAHVAMASRQKLDNSPTQPLVDASAGHMDETELQDDDWRLSGTLHTWFQRTMARRVDHWGTCAETGGPIMGCCGVTNITISPRQTSTRLAAAHGARSNSSSFSPYSPRMHDHPYRDDVPFDILQW